MKRSKNDDVEDGIKMSAYETITLMILFSEICVSIGTSVF